jgi:hypothetical protein
MWVLWHAGEDSTKDKIRRIVTGADRKRFFTFKHLVFFLAIMSEMALVGIADDMYHVQLASVDDIGKHFGQVCVLVCICGSHACGQGMGRFLGIC